MLMMSCSSTSLRRNESVLLSSFAPRMERTWCSSSSLRQLSCWLSRASSSED